MDSLAFDAGAVTAIIGYTAQVKNFLPERWQKASILISCALGVLYSVSIRPGRQELARNVTSGIMLGLAASGGFCGMKSFVEAKRG